MFTDPAAWIWEYSTLDGATVKTAFEYSDLDDLKKDVEESFFNIDHTWEEVERRGIYGTAVLVKQHGRYRDTGHWVYHKRQEKCRTAATTSIRPRET